MELLQFLPVLVLTSLCQSCPTDLSLHCLNDYINSVTCTWNSTRVCNGTCERLRSDTPCSLLGFYIRTKKSYKGNCTLKSSGGPDSASQSCTFSFSKTIFFRSMDTMNIEVKCEDSVMDRIKGYKPANSIKLHPPGPPQVNGTTLSWNGSWPLSRFTKDVHYQVQWKQAGQLGEVSPLSNMIIQTYTNKHLDLPVDRLRKGGTYEAMIRATVNPKSYNCAEWSDWSPTASWESTMGQETTGLVSDFSSFEGLVGTITVGAVAMLFLFVVTLLKLIKSSNLSRFYKLKNHCIPDPSWYFNGLHSIHSGNFEAWLGSLFNSESYNFVNNFEQVSPVVVSDGQANSSLWRKEVGGALEQWDSSGHSTCSNYSNSSYFYPLYSGSSSQQAKPELCTMSPSCGLKCRCNVKLPAGVRGCHGLPKTDKSKHPKKVQAPQEDPLSPDSGFQGGIEDQETLEDSDRPSETDSRHEPLLHSSLTLTHGSTPFLPLLPSLTPMSFLLPSLGGDRHAGKLLEEALRSASFGTIEPSSGGYMPVQQVEP